MIRVRAEVGRSLNAVAENKNKCHSRGPKTSLWEMQESSGGYNRFFNTSAYRLKCLFWLMLAKLIFKKIESKKSQI